MGSCFRTGRATTPTSQAGSIGRRTWPSCATPSPGLDRVRALGTRHSFTDLADTDGELVSTGDLPVEVDLDAERSTVRVSAGLRYGDLGDLLAKQGWALATMASLPHISVAGAVATGTHGSGDRTGSLAAAVAALEFVDAAGELRTVSRGDADFAGSVVRSGRPRRGHPCDARRRADVRRPPGPLHRPDLGGRDRASRRADLERLQRQPLHRLDRRPDRQVWLKSRATDPAPGPVGCAGRHRDAAHARGRRHRGGDPAGRRPGPWQRRLPHFRMEFTPSRGEELQTEYLVPRDQGGRRRSSGCARSRPRSPDSCRSPSCAPSPPTTSGSAAPTARTSSASTSPGCATSRACTPCSRRSRTRCSRSARDRTGASASSPEPTRLRSAYPRFDDFRELALRLDPARKFGNAFLTRHLDL